MSFGEGDEEEEEGQEERDKDSQIEENRMTFLQFEGKIQLIYEGQDLLG